MAENFPSIASTERRLSRLVRYHRRRHGEIVGYRSRGGQTSFPGASDLVGTEFHPLLWRIVNERCGLTIGISEGRLYRRSPACLSLAAGFSLSDSGLNVEDIPGLGAGIP
jgi:hypothetical protein